MARTVTGTGATPLADVGTAHWHRPEADLPDDESAGTPTEEQARFDAAVETAREELEAERERTRELIGEEEAGVFDAHIQFLADPQIEDSVTDDIEDGLAAGTAVEEAFADPISQFEAMDGMMAERADDLRDVRDRLLRILADGERIDLSALPAGTVLLAERLTPSDTAQLDPARIAGFATVEGGRTSHAAIFARSLGIPAVVGVGSELDAIEAGTEVVVDGDAGEVVAEPDSARKARTTDERTVGVRNEPVETADEFPIEVAANVGTPAEIESAVEHGADGIGLFRTEFLFLNREAPPDEDEQYETLVETLSAFPDGRVVVRTLDVGGDKPIPYLDQPAEANPFLGERGIRRSLDVDESLFRTQIRALLRAAASEHGDGLSVMFPLVSTIEELDRALETVEDVAAQLEAEGEAWTRPELGVMIETPSAVFVAPELAARVDFFSIGTNDLTQYVMATSRENDRIAHLHDPCHPAVLRAIDRIVSVGHDHDCWVGMCGEMAGDPAVLELLVGLGLDELSMSAITIPDVKAAITETTRDDARTLASDALAATTFDDVQKHLNP
ncbi:phosphoenolpyruvate--protein phosphotransferase [Haladaptatus sp. DYSN1]|uniref:phosphoenolpyruvate--protein phosphotransferase n=1 Tax=unclassified Haladaptatus TaxID=2622732 RepID=UPI0024057AC2|nr:phosphoenolpyruvate--protein phosphotransferase [Haladaptatus sp. DYSN1]